MRVGIVGLGYVGLPLAVGFAAAGRGRRRRRHRPAPGRGARARGAPTSRTSPTRRSRRRSRASRSRPTTPPLAGVDAVLICVPTPLTREPRARSRAAARQRRGARPDPPARAARRARVDHLSGHHARAGRAAARGAAACAPASTSTSPSRPSASTRAAPTTRSPPRRRSSAGSREACGDRAEELYRLVCDEVVRVATPRGGRADEAAREHLPRGQHRARQRARDADRPDGHRHLGGHRRRVDQALRLHALRARAPGWAATACPVDPFYLSWRAREFDMSTEFIELAGKVNQQMPYHCVAKLQRTLNDRGKPVRGSRIAVLGVALQAGRRRRARVAGAEDHRAAARAGRATSSTTTRYVRRAAAPRPALASPLEDALDDADLVLIVTAHPDVDYDADRRARRRACSTCAA